MEHIFLQISVVLGVALIVGLLANILRQPLIIAYLAAGIAAGPVLLNIISPDDEVFTFFAKLGVILLMFVIGLNLNLNFIKKIGRAALIIGLVQALITSAVGILILRLVQFDWWTACYLAIATTFSSTIIITKILGDKKHLDSLYGRHVVGILLVQDFVAIGLMAVLIAFGQGDTASWATILFMLAAKGLLVVAAVWVVARYFLPLALNYIAKSVEFLFLFSLAWCFAIAALADLVGISYEIGAILAGAALGASAFAPAIAGRVKPLRDFFLILFFVILGAQLNVQNFTDVLFPSIILSVFILLGDPIILYLLFRVLRFTRRNSFLAGLTAAQVSEFGFVLLYVGVGLGKISNNDLSIFTLSGLVTIFISSFLLAHNEKIYHFFSPALSLFGKDKHKQTEEQVTVYDVWVVGYHRIGWKLVETLKREKASFAIIDFNPEVIRALRRQGIPAYFGDITDIDFISSLPLEKAELIISTIPDVEAQVTLIKKVREQSRKVCMIVNAPEARYRQWLYATGADYVMTPHLLGGELLATLLHGKIIQHDEINRLRAQQKMDAQSGMPIDNL